MKPVPNMLRDDAVSVAEITYCRMSWPVSNLIRMLQWFGLRSNPIICLGRLM